MSAPHAHGGPECKALFARLSEYLDGEIDPEGCAHVDAHLADCPACRDFLESLRRTIGLLQSDPAGSLPDDARNAVLEAWRRAKQALPGG